MAPGEICILAGGLSTRMGRDKARLRLEGKTLLRHVRDAAWQTHWPVRVIRHDLVKRCGPLGGIYTGLKTTRAECVLFLACDMPFVTVELLEKVMQRRRSPREAIYCSSERGGKAGFPFLLPKKLLGEIEALIAARQFSLQILAAKCKARLVVVANARKVLFNLNTPEDLSAAKDLVGTPRA